MVPSSNTWLKAEDVDWTAVAKRFKRSVTTDGLLALPVPEETTVEAASSKKCIVQTSMTATPVEIVSIESLSSECIAKALETHVEAIASVVMKVRELVMKDLGDRGSVPRETVDSCKLILKADPETSIRSFIVPLVLSGRKNACELTERLVDSAFVERHLETLLSGFVDSKQFFFPSDEAILFWQRAVFTNRVPERFLGKIVAEMDYVPVSSTRLAGCILALTKANRDDLVPFVHTLTSLLSRLSGVLTVPAKKALQQIGGGRAKS